MAHSAHFSSAHPTFTNWYEQKYAHLRPSDDDSHPFGAKKSPETRTRENLTRTYEARSNTCSKCFTQRASISGKCLCE